MDWGKRDKRKCIEEFCSMRPQAKGLETYEDYPEFAIRSERSKLNLYYDDFGYDEEEIKKLLETKNSKGERMKYERV